MLIKGNLLNGKAIAYGILAYAGMFGFSVFFAPVLSVVWDVDFTRFIELYMFCIWAISGCVTGLMVRSRGFVHGLIVGCTGAVFITLFLNFVFPLSVFRFYVRTVISSGVVSALFGAVGRMISREKPESQTLTLIRLEADVKQLRCFSAA